MRRTNTKTFRETLTPDALSAIDSLCEHKFCFSRAKTYNLDKADEGGVEVLRDITIEDYLAGAKVSGGEFDFFILMSQNHWT